MHTILIAEDEESFRRAFVAYLQDRGYAVRAAADGQEALRLLAKGDIDLAVLDLFMPGLNGKAVIASIRTDARLAGLPIVVLTATTVPDLEAELRPFVQEWLTKTKTSLADVERVIRRLLDPPSSLGGVPAPR